MANDVFFQVPRFLPLTFSDSFTFFGSTNFMAYPSEHRGKFCGAHSALNSLIMLFSQFLIEMFSKQEKLNMSFGFCTDFFLWTHWDEKCKQNYINICFVFCFSFVSFSHLKLKYIACIISWLRSAGRNINLWKPSTTVQSTNSGNSTSTQP